jgi:shikimate kinase
VYLEEECSVIMERLLDPKGRGVTIREGQTIAELYAERKALYERYAEYTVNVNSKSADEVVTSIINAVAKNQSV